MNNDGVFKWDDDYMPSVGMRLISPWDLATSYQSRTDVEGRCLGPAGKPDYFLNRGKLNIAGDIVFAAKSSISWVSRIPPIVEPARLRRAL